jgi:predicted TIM-barrel fold metal-dependent hydrolase
MFRDPIVEEVRKAREEYAQQFNFNLRDMVADLERRQRESGRKTVSFPPKRKSTVIAVRDDGKNNT